MLTLNVGFLSSLLIFIGVTLGGNPSQGQDLTLMDVCKVPEDLDAPKDEFNRKNCTGISHFTIEPQASMTPAKAAKGPTLKEIGFSESDTVYCRYFYRYQNGASNKFRCYRTNSQNQLLNTRGEVIGPAVTVGEFNSDEEAILLDDKNQPILNKKGNPEKADILKVRFQDGSSRHRENYASTVASRFAWILGFPMEHYYSVEKVECFGCQKDPWQNGEAPQQSNIPGIVNTFWYASIERKFEAKRVYKPYAPKDKSVKSIAWSWNDFASEVENMTQPRRIEFENLALFANLFQILEFQGLQHVLLCEKEFYDKDQRICKKTLAAIHDMGAAFGNRTLRDPQMDNNHPRADFAGYSKVKLFKGSSCEIGYNPPPLANFLPESFREFRTRLSLLTPEIIKAVLKSAHFEYADLPFRSLVERNLRNTHPKLTTQELNETILSKWTALIQEKISEQLSQSCY